MPYPDNEEEAPEASALEEAWDALELWLEENFTPEEVRRVMESRLELRRGRVNESMSKLAARTWGAGSSVIEKPDSWELHRPNLAPVYLGGSFVTAKAALLKLRDGKG